MPLEDFFTLTEMKDGLATLARVEELVGVMKKEEENIIKNAGDAARQWSTVASILAATENKECLNYFIQLDGLLFLDQWLQEAQKWSDDTSDNYLAEPIDAILGALEKLPLGNKQSTASGIGLTVKHLLGHKCSKVQEKARALFCSWNQVQDKRTNYQDGEEGEACLGDEPLFSPDVKKSSEGGHRRSPVLDVLHFKENADEVNSAGEPAGSELQHSNTTKSSGFSQQDETNDVHVPKSDENIPPIISNQTGGNGSSGEAKPLGCSPISNTCQEILAIANESSPNQVDSNEKSSEVQEPNDIIDCMEKLDAKMNVMECSSNNVGEKETCDNSSFSKPKEIVSMAACSVNDQKSVIEASVPYDNDTKEVESCSRQKGSADLGSGDGAHEFQLKNDKVDCEMLTCSRNIDDLKHEGKVGEGHTEALQDLSSNGCTSRMIGSSENSLDGKAAFSDDDVKDPDSRSNSEASDGESSGIPSDFLKPMMDTLDSNGMCKGNSDMELDYGVDDALEVARQVAKEVEREVVDYRGPFCGSSPDKNSVDEIMQFGSPHPMHVKQDELVMENLDEVKVEPSTKRDLHGDHYSPEMKRLRISDNAGDKPGDGGEESELPASTAGAQELVGEVEKNKCDFDLNEDVYKNEIECYAIPMANQQVRLSAPIPVVAASKGTAGFPSAPLHFEGEMGWRGSASTSAFRPAFPRKTQDSGERASLVEGSSNGSKMKRSFPKIDLNVVDKDEDIGADPASTKEIPTLDLNCIGDSDDACPFPSTSDWRVNGTFHHQNGHGSQSQASSSLPKQPLMRDFDLNDNLLSVDTLSSQDRQLNLHKSSFQEVNGYGSFKLNDPISSIMGSRVDAHWQESFHQTRSFLQNGWGEEPAMGADSVRLSNGSGAQPPLTYAPTLLQASGYNDLTREPSTSFPLHMYGFTSSVHPMVDSRGATFIPQILGSSAPISSPSYSKPPFLMSLTSAPTSLTEVAVTRSDLDLNSGMASVDGENSEMGNLRQFFSHGHGLWTSR